MKSSFLLALAAALLALFLFQLPACSTNPKQARDLPKRPDTKNVLQGQENKDKVVGDEADNIDKKVEGTPQEADVKASTDAQRKAIADNPATDLKPVFDGLNQIIDTLQKENKALKAENKDLKDQALREQARWLTWAGVGLLTAFGVSVAFGGGLAAAAKTWPLVLLAVGAFGLAQFISHPWFLPGFVVVLVGGVIYSAWWVWRKHEDGKLAQSLAKKENLLKQILPVLDNAYENASADVQAILDKDVFDKLSSRFSKEDKATILEVKADAKRATG